MHKVQVFCIVCSSQMVVLDIFGERGSYVYKEFIKFLRIAFWLSISFLSIVILLGKIFILCFDFSLTSFITLKVSFNVIFVFFYKIWVVRFPWFPFYIIKQCFKVTVLIFMASFFRYLSNNFYFPLDNFTRPLVIHGLPRFVSLMFFFCSGKAKRFLCQHHAT